MTNSYEQDESSTAVGLDLIYPVLIEYLKLRITYGYDCPNFCRLVLSRQLEALIKQRIT